VGHALLPRLKGERMRLQMKALHDQINDSVWRYADEKLRKLDRRLHDLTLVELTLSREHNPSIRDDHAAEAIVYTKGPTIVAHEAATTYEAAIDKLVDKLERQVERYRDKRTHEVRRRANHREPPPPTPVEEIERELRSGEAEESVA
jgi:putative sigma-54 modulation protein